MITVFYTIGERDWTRKLLAKSSGKWFQQVVAYERSFFQTDEPGGFLQSLDCIINV